MKTVYLLLFSALATVAFAQNSYLEYVPSEYLYQNEFNTGKNFSFETVSGYHDHGYMIFERSGNLISTYNLVSDLDMNKDFEAEVRVKILEAAQPTDAVGFIIGEFKNWDTHRFNIDSQGKHNIKTNVNDKFEDLFELRNAASFVKGEFNVYTIRKVGNNVSIYVNGYIQAEHKIKNWYGNELRLRVSGGVKQQVDYIYVAYIKKGDRPFKDFKNAANFNDRPIRQPNQIYNAYSPIETVYQTNMTDASQWSTSANVYLDRGELIMKVNNSSYQYRKGQELPLDEFQVEMDIRSVQFEKEQNYGLLLFTEFDDWDNYEAYYFLVWPDVRNQANFQVSQRKEVAGKVTTNSLGFENLTAILPDRAFNKFTVRRNADTVTFFLNEAPAISFLEEKKFHSLGIRAEATNSTVAFDNLKISKIEPRSSSTKAIASTNSTDNYQYHTGPLKNPFPFPLIVTDNAEFQRAKEAYIKQNYDLSLRLMKELAQYYPESGEVYLYLGLNELQFRNYDVGYKYIKTASILNPSDIATQVNMVIFSALTQKSTEAYKYASTLAKMVNKEWHENNVNYLQGFANSFANYAPQGSALLKQVNTYYQQEYQKASHKYYSVVEDEVFYQVDQSPLKYAAQIIPRMNTATRLIKEEGIPYSIQHAMLLRVHDILARERDNPKNNKDWQDWFDRRAFDITKAIWNTFESGEIENDYQTIKFSELKYNSMLNSGDLENALALNGIRIETVKNSPFLTYSWHYLLAQRMTVLAALDRREEARELEKIVLQGLAQYKNPEYQIIANTAMGHANRFFDMEKSLKYSLEAEKVIETTGFEENKTATYNRISIAYFDLKQNNKGIEYAIKAAEAIDDPLKKAPNYTSLAVAYMRAGDLAKSVETYRVAEDLYIEAIKIKSEYQANRAYQLLYQNNFSLALSLVETGKTTEAFEAIERANNLRFAQKIQGESSERSITVNEIQQLLKPDQAILYYASDPFAQTTFINFVITKNEIKTHTMLELEELLDVRNKYADSLAIIEKNFALNEMRQANFITNADLMQGGDFNLLTEHLRKSFKGNDYKAIAEVGGSYYDLFVKPFENEIKSKKDLIIVPSATLGFIPFEGLLTSEAKLLVELYDISYVQSPTIWRTLQKRNYGTRPKTILAMGGANYGEPNIKANIIRSYADVDRIKYEVFDGISDSVKTFRQQWADLGHLRHVYLQGTKNEVEAIKQLVPTTDLLIGDDMSESRIKTMSANGSLDDYQVLHFATHGWVENFVPSLSGLTMSIFPDERNGEDGHIYLHEASQLKLKADMVMLSACQTGLGKAEVGQGVAGLNQAFLSAGANSTVVSLWSVNDYATSLLASEMYRLRFKEGMTFNKALNQVKRNFIQGVYNQPNFKLDKPEYWAPFVYYGKTE